MNDQISQNEQLEQDKLFKLTMGKKWRHVLEIYTNNPLAHETKLTKSEETALHIAVSGYHSKRPTNTVYIDQMIDLVKDEVLLIQNVKGDTPLHLAAAVGWVSGCARMAKRNQRLIGVRNRNGESPLFVAAHHGNLQAFLCLYHMLRNTRNDQGREADNPDDSLCRRGDGNTILHAAITGEYFRLAYQIISYYPKLVNYVNVEGDSPLHVLARKPNVFKSSSRFGFYDSFIHYCVVIDDLKEEKYNPAIQDRYSPGGEISLPENYRTCVDVFFLLWTPIIKSFRAGFSSFNKQNNDQVDLEIQLQNDANESESTDNMNQRKKDSYPPNYKTCVKLVRFLTKVILTVVGVGFWRIKKIREKKERYSHSHQIMNRMIEFEARYMYDSNGQRPAGREEGSGGIPKTAPHAEEHKNAEETKNADANAILKKDTDTPLLVAAKMGIPEMVKKIISKCPVAIEDLDSNGKNVLMLAAENRQANVLGYLLNMNLPEYMFNQLDDEGNNILHLAAKLGDIQPWSIPGAALQMQWEIKWFKHVKRSVPAMSFALNSKGETPGKIFTRTHQYLVKEGSDWLIKTSESCSVVAALIAAVAFATAATVPGGLDQNSGHPIFQYHRAFDIFTITSLMALCQSVTALVFFLAIITSRCEERDFKANLPNKLLMGLTSLFTSIAVMLLSFCAGHTLILSNKLKLAAWPIYAVASLPVTFFAMAQLPLYFDIVWAACRKVPLRSYKVIY